MASSNNRSNETRAFDLINAFYNKTKAKNINWVVKGFITGDGAIYPIGHDTKLLGRIFEVLTEPILHEIADENGYVLEAPKKQNFYPDFILTPTSGGINERIAIDIKTTYRDYGANGQLKRFGFTLGSYTSFLRNETKNIQYRYSDYIAHYVIGFVYDRKEYTSTSKYFVLDELDNVPVPYENVEYFIQEKHRIAGFGTGSRNTENIGTIRVDSIEPFRRGEGPFSAMGSDVFEYYWRHYPRYRATKKEYTNFETFFAWLMANEDSVPEGILSSAHDYGESSSSSEYEVKEF